MQQLRADAMVRLVEEFDDLAPALVRQVVGERFDANPVTGDTRIAAVFAVDLAVVRLQPHRL